MNVKIISVHNHGDFDKEYVLLRVETDCDIGHYQLCDTTYTATGNVSNRVRHPYWFPDKLVRKGELVALWTKAGNNTAVKNAAGTVVHRFYWGLKTAVWNNSGDCAVLQHVPRFQAFKAHG